MPGFPDGYDNTSMNSHSSVADTGTPKPEQGGAPSDEERAAGLPALSSREPQEFRPWYKKRRLLLPLLLLLLAILIGAIVGGVVGSKRKGSNRASSGSAGASGSGTSSASPSRPTGPTTGSDGSTITDEKGNTFIYRNPLGGKWVSVPFDDSAQAQSDVPPLDQPWDYQNLRIYGVNLGGWLTLEPFIAPALYEPFEHATTQAIDEYTLCTNLGDSLATTIETHYDTFITEEDFARIAGAGLNWVRIALPYWAIETFPGEPFLEGVAWKYFLKAITWARKYGLRINLDFHAVPGSQNGWNHSSKFGTVNFLSGRMGIANAQRVLNYLRTLTEFISQPQYSNVVPMFSILNEAQVPVIGTGVIRAFYLEAYNMIRAISGFGQGKGPMITIHDGFIGQPQWAGFLAGADRISLDTHPYLCFGDTANTASMAQNAMVPCSQWSPNYNRSMAAFGFSMAGEWSIAVNDCGQYVTGVGYGTRYEGTYPTPERNTTARAGSCDQWVDDSTWSDELKSQFRQLQFAYADGLQNTFFWTWKIGNTTRTNPPRIANPMWSYSNGLQQGYIDPNPRRAVGSCAAFASQFGVAAPAVVDPGTFEPNQIGGVANPTIAAAQVQSYGTWPPVSIVSAGAVAGLPVYTPTGTPITLPASTPTVTGSIGPGNGWAQANDRAGWYTPIAGCSAYVDPWQGVQAGTPASVAGCTAAPAAGRRALAEPTPAPLPL